MAGLAKPDVVGLGAEVEVTIISSGGGAGAVTGLFNGVCVDEWDTDNVFYWNTTTTYFEFSVNKAVNIWRSGTSTWGDVHKSKFRIEKKQDDGTYYDITDTIVQNVTNIDETQWEKTVYDLQAGTYLFYAQTTRLDSEWYVEESTATHKPIYFYRYLKEELPTLVDITNNEAICFTDDGGIYLNKNDGTLRQVGVDDETLEKINNSDGVDIVTVLDSTATDDQVVSAKLLYDLLNEKADADDVVLLDTEDGTIDDVVMTEYYDKTEVDSLVASLQATIASLEERIAALETT